jgi:hypothetical protein
MEDCGVGVLTSNSIPTRNTDDPVSPKEDEEVQDQVKEKGQEQVKEQEEQEQVKEEEGQEQVQIKEGQAHVKEQVKEQVKEKEAYMQSRYPSSNDFPEVPLSVQEEVDKIVAKMIFDNAERMSDGSFYMELFWCTLHLHMRTSMPRYTRSMLDPQRITAGLRAAGWRVEAHANCPNYAVELRAPAPV